MLATKTTRGDVCTVLCYVSMVLVVFVIALDLWLLLVVRASLVITSAVLIFMLSVLWLIVGVTASLCPRILLACACVASYIVATKAFRLNLDRYRGRCIYIYI